MKPVPPHSTVRKRGLVSGYPSPSPWSAIKRDLVRPGRRPVIAVVAFIGRHAPTVMPLRRGDMLVCDASDLAVKQQLSSPTSLRSYHRKGVAIFSVQGLHAKVISSPTSAWVGSANASKNSSEYLVEASVRVTGDQARRVRTWAESLATEENELSLSDIARLATLKTYPRRPGPRVEVTPTEIPKRISNLVFISTSKGRTPREEADVASDRRSAVGAARKSGFNSSLIDVLSRDATSMKPGDWVIDIRNGHVSRPACVIRKKLTRSGWVVWLSEVQCPNRPSVAVLRSILPVLSSDFGELRLKESSTIRKVLNLYR